MNKKNAWTLFKIIGFTVSIILLITYISFLLNEFEKNVRKEETKSVVSSMADLSDQGAEMVEERIGAALNSIEHTARLLEGEQDIQSKSVMEKINSILIEKNTAINRFGVANLDGMSMVNNGQIIDVSDREYFIASKEGKTYVSGSTKSRLNHNLDVFFISVPIYDQEEHIKGVLYGIIETSQFRVYENINLEHKNQNIYIIDINGNYISRFLSKEAFIGQSNFFDDIKERECSVSSEKMKKNMIKNESTYAEINKEGKMAYLYVAPSNIDDWYVVTVVTEEVIDLRVSHLQNYALDFIRKISILMIIFCILYFFTISYEKYKTEEINRELRIRDNIFQIATTEMESFIFLYDVAKDKIDFMNSSITNLGIPKTIGNATKNLVSYFAPINKGQLKDAITKVQKALVKKEETTEIEVFIKRSTGDSYYQVKMNHLYDEKKRPIRSIGMVYDMSEEKVKELYLQKEKKMRNILMTNTIAFYEIDVMNDLVIQNDENKVISCYSETLERFVEERVVEEYKNLLLTNCSLAFIKHCFEKNMLDYVVEYEYKRADGSLYWVACEMHLEEENNKKMAFMTIRDINEKKRRELHLEQQAVYDSLTQIYNRDAGMKKINLALQEMQPGELSAFLILDIDNFKKVNDTLGHIMGDHVLIDVAKVLKSHFRSYDILCRLGGDEFVVFVQKMPEEALDKIVSSLLKKLVITYGFEDRNITISASIGVALAPRQGQDFVNLYEKADQALYQVKKTTKNAYMLYHN